MDVLELLCKLPKRVQCEAALLDGRFWWDWKVCKLRVRQKIACDDPRIAILNNFTPNTKFETYKYGGADHMWLNISGSILAEKCNIDFSFEKYVHSYDNKIYYELHIYKAYCKIGYWYFDKSYFMAFLSTLGIARLQGIPYKPPEIVNFSY